jgi:hypothetical protein
MRGRTRKPPDRRQRRNRPKVIYEVCVECWRPAEYRAAIFDGRRFGPWCERHAIAFVEQLQKDER